MELAEREAEVAAVQAMAASLADEYGVEDRPVVILTHRAREGAVRDAAAAVGALGFSRSEPVVLPVLERGG